MAAEHNVAENDLSDLISSSQAFETSEDTTRLIISFWIWDILNDSNAFSIRKHHYIDAEPTGFTVETGLVRIHDLIATQSSKCNSVSPRKMDFFVNDSSFKLPNYNIHGCVAGIDIFQFVLEIEIKDGLLELSASKFVEKPSLYYKIRDENLWEWKEFDINRKEILKIATKSVMVRKSIVKIEKHMSLILYTLFYFIIFFTS